MMANILLLMFCVLQLTGGGILGCVNMWDSQPGDTNICPVQTDSNQPCMFPFTYDNSTYNTCTVKGPNNLLYLPQCMTGINTWSFCKVPTDSIITYVTTRKAGRAIDHGVSLNGETLVWIYGYRFAKNIFSITPTTTSNNKVFLESSFASYECEIHPDKVTDTQITCWTPSLPAGVYLVRVYVNNKLIPFYQYVEQSEAVIEAKKESTPKIQTITPARDVPGSFVSITGDFKTDCYGRDTDACADDQGSRISRVYFGPQLCDLMNSISLTLYDNLTTTYLKCKLQGSTIGIFNTSMLVSEDNGRSIADSSTYLITPDELIYNFQTYAEITNISPNSGSTEGLSTVTITGKYLYHADSIPARIEVAGSQCNVKSFDNTDQLNSKIVCETQTSQGAKTEYIGNRGVNLIRDNIYTSFGSLATAKPSTSASTIWLDAASYNDNNTVDVTIWLNGFLTPAITSDYVFSLKTNGAANFFLSTDSNSVNKELVASYDPSTLSSTSQTKTLEGGKTYYLEVISSKQGGLLNIDANAKMLNSHLNGNVSSMIKTEVQDIEIKSTIIPETTVISYNGLQSGNGTAEVQELKILPGASNDFTLNFDGANTINLLYGATASEVEKALNDLPTLESEGVTVSREASSDGGVLYTVTFSANRGDVPAISETAGNVVFSNNEIVKGVPSQSKFQLSINNAWSNLFDLVNDPISTISDAIETAFKIRCPLSIQKQNPATTFALFDYESECQYDEQELGLSAFCGKCARKNSDSLFWNVNSPLTYNQLCFAYKLTKPIQQIGFTVFIDGDLNQQRNAYVSVTTTADNQWHYDCFDIYQGLLKSWSTNAATYPSYRLTIIGAWIYPVAQDVYVDVVSIRNTVPTKYNDDSLLTTRRVFPKLQMVYNSLTVKRDSINSKLTVSYRPNNCTINVPLSALRQSISNLPSVVRSASATGPVDGIFNLQWNSINLNGVSSQVTENTLKNLLQSISGLGTVNVARSKDCAGYKWQVQWIEGGDKSPISIPSNSLAGNSPSISSKTFIDGGIEYYPIQGDMLRTTHTKAQFTVNINGIQSKCSANCNFEWLASETPVVTDIDTSNPNSIKITGSGFDATNLMNNVVTIGSTPCSVTSATSVNLYCTPGKGAVGTYKFQVKVIPKGLATMNSAATFTFNLNIDSFSPLVAGTGGGVLLQINGVGFSDQTIIKIDSNVCPIKSLSYTSITCYVPYNPTAVDKLVNIQAVDGSFTATASQQLQYDNTNTPIIDNVTPSSNLNVAGGQLITITGSNFNTAISQVYFGNEPASVESFSTTQIVVKSPGMNPGLYDLIIPSGAIGNAKTGVKLAYTLYVSSITPNSGSIRGGTLVTIYGDGFNTNCSQNNVKFEETTCKVIDCAKQWLRCETTNANKIYLIDNNGYDPYYGRGYAWSQSYLNINQGDYVSWSWGTPGTISDINYKVEQVSDPTSTVPSGFTSGAPTATGNFIYQFNKIGTYYYWSGYVDGNSEISFRGVINVNPATDRTLSIDVSVNGFKAQKCIFPFEYKGQNYSSCTNLDLGYNWCSPTSIYNGQAIKCAPQDQPPSSTCTGSNVNLGSCSISNPLSNYDFVFTSCANSVASVTSISPLKGSVGDQITITGSGFSSVLCENNVLIGEYSCPILSSSATKIVCQIGANSGLIPNNPYSIEIRKNNIGNAVQNDWYKFSFVPKILSLSPSIGSVAGGTTVLISGDGFVADSTVLLLSGIAYSKSNAEITYNQISIKTMSNSVGVVALTVYVNGIEAVCGAVPNCNYEFSSQIAPTLISVSPTSVSDATTITISGTKFGNDPTKLSVLIGTQVCTVTSATDSTITCSLPGLNVGPQTVIVNLSGVGKAIQSSSVVSVTGVPAVKSLNPSSGSVYGGTILTIIGNGFDTIQNTQVKIGSKICTVTSVSSSQIVCLTPDNTPGTLTVLISSNGLVFPTKSFTYDSSLSPTVSQISPSSGTDGALITISGSGFGSNTSNFQSTGILLKIGDASCVIQSISDTQIICKTGLNVAGSYPVLVQIDVKGYANKNIQYTYNLVVSSVSALESSYGGGLEIKIIGSGLAGTSTGITICNNNCLITGYTDASQVSCKVPSRTYANTDSVCSLTVTVNGASITKTFTYKNQLTPTLSDVAPIRGGTGGGTLITITGNGFPTNDKSKVLVTIAGSKCDVVTITSTTIICNTGPYSSSSVTAPVMVYIDSIGYASNTSSVEYQYIDLWSSKFTWGGTYVPQEGELVVIGFGQTIYLDTVTPVLKGVIIQGGALIFDDNQDVNLNAEYIVIVDNGKLQVGTEANPFQHKATITMYGTLRAIELPIFGSKVLALRNGTIDLHGKNVGRTWTYLAATAVPQSTQIQLIDPVKWPVGSKIVIVTTGDLKSQKESEVRNIVAISSDGKTIILDAPLNYQHLSEKRTNAGVDVYIRAEVGLLSHNVIFNAVNDNSWNSLRTAKACPSGFNPGLFATMTCYLGRYGDEIGSDEFGATIMINSAQPNQIGKESVIARLSNVELYHVGQAYRLGRYAIHFHMIGDSPSSYIRECSIYESFNRAVNIHATNYVTVERTVIYNIMGGAFFLEDGIEIGNVFQYNLAVFVKTSSALLNEDVTPAAFWATNPNNTWQHNAVAGGTHFGWWYRILDHPDGPSFSPDYCPKKIPFGKFFNNSAHSCGMFGIWVFPGYNPTVSGGCNDYNGSPAKFDTYVSYGNDKGAEYVAASSIQFKNFVIFDQITAGIEARAISQHSGANTVYSSRFYNENLGPVISDSVIIGNSDPEATASITHRGLVIAKDRGLLVKNVKLINFPDNDSYAIGAIERCVTGCGGWTTHFTGMSFSNVLYKTVHKWPWDTILLDLDGSLSGNAGNVVLYNTNITNGDSRCKTNSAYLNGTVCSQTTDWIRFAFNYAVPESAIFADIQNERGDYDMSPKLVKRLTHPKGYMVALEANQIYGMDFDQVSYPTNISYTGVFYGLKPNQYIIMKHKMAKKPDQVFVYGVEATESTTSLSFSGNNNGDWHWENSTRTLSYIVHNKESITPILDAEIDFSAKKCRFVNCQVPQQPALRLPATKRPADAVYWSNATTWQTASIIKTAKGFTQSGLPNDYDSIKIPDGLWVVVDMVLPKLTRVQIDGVLEFDDTIDNQLVADEILINGGQLIVGWENQPFIHNLEIILTGTKAAIELILPNGFDSMGAKAIGVYGGLDLHGKPRTPSWTRLSTTALTGANTLLLEEAVDWVAGDEIVISTTSYDPFQTETFKITQISSDKRSITLNTTLAYDHIAASETFANGKSYSIAAGVGLLTRNIKVIGSEYETQFGDLFGSRIIVSDYSDYLYPEGSNIPVLVYYKGYARVSDVEFKHFGQFSRASEDDFKYGILFSNLEVYDTSRPSYVRNCAFHSGFSAAVGIRTSASIPIENNVIHRSFDFSVRVEGNSNIIRKNLIVLNIWSPTFLVSDAPFEIAYWGAITVRDADSVVMEDNLIAGSQRLGLSYRGSPCPGKSLGSGFNHSIQGNSIYGTLLGAVILPTYAFDLDCILISGFTIYKAIYNGLYYQAIPDVIVDSNILIDNQLSVFTQVFSPTATSHVFNPDRQANVTNNLFVGTSPSFNCLTDIPPDDLNKKYSALVESYGARDGGKIGIVWANFLGNTNLAPVKPWYNIKTYNYINGLLRLDGNTFAHFKKSCGSSVDAAITSSKNNDDGQMPVAIKNTKLYDVDLDSKIYLHRPNTGKINPSDCVDMDCDGMKKNLLTDLDGSFLDSIGTVISQSEYGWGSQSRGLGDYRIPKEALSDVNGHLINPSSIYSYPGIVRDANSCTYRDSWQAYECHGIDYRMMIIESMDNDTETRRLSPVAILSDNKYLDLINGPQDHTCCLGYPCFKRLSTFLAIVAANKHYDVFLTATPPDRLRFRIINADENFKIRLSMYYSTSNNINLYKNINLVDPTNADRSTGSLVLKDPQGNPSQYMPVIGSVPGTNYFSRQDRKIYFSIDGSDYIDLVISTDIFLTFGVKATTADAFFNSANLVSNIATLLGVPPSMIRRVEIVKETGTSSRIVKRLVENIVGLRVLVSSDPPTISTNSGEFENNQKEIGDISSSITEQFLFGKLQNTATQMGIDIKSLSIKSNSTSNSLQQVASMKIVQDISQCRAQSPCVKQAKLQLLNKNGQPIEVSQFGNQLAVVAKILKTSTNTEIINEYQVYFDASGIASFLNLGFSIESSSVTIKYSIQGNNIDTKTISVFDVTSESIAVEAPLLAVSQVESEIKVAKGNSFEANFYLIDKISKTKIPNPLWKQQTWKSCIGIYNLDLWQISNVNLKASESCVSLNTANNLFEFKGLTIDKPGMYILQVNITSSDNQFLIYGTSNRIRVSLSDKTENELYFNILQLEFDGTFVESEREKYVAMVYNYFFTKFENLEIIGPIACFAGSIILNGGIDISNATKIGNAVSKTISNNPVIIPGAELRKISYLDSNFTIEKVSVSSSSGLSTSSNIGAIVGGTLAGIALLGLVAVASAFYYRYKKSKVENQIEAGKMNNAKKILIDEQNVIFPNESVTVGREKSFIGMARTLDVKTPENLFISREVTANSIKITPLEDA